MLFDLRGRGRRRTVQVIYLSLAILMGGGLVLFGIGGNTSGGLFDAFSGNGGGSGSSNTDAATQKRVDTYVKRIRANPQDQVSLVSLAKLRFQIANTGENYNAQQQAFTAKGVAELRQSTSVWQRYLALNPKKPDAQTANLMVQAYGAAGLKQYDKAVQALEIVIDSRAESSGLYANLAVLASGANQTRKSQLAEQKAIDLAPKDQRKQLKSDIDLAKSQITVQSAGQSSGTGSGSG
jgi:tetratricopeptide (TPR) repeat protein